MVPKQCLISGTPKRISAVGAVEWACEALKPDIKQHEQDAEYLLAQGHLEAMTKH